MTEKLRQAIEQTVAILGPEAPLCSGCVEEWTEALRILNDALAESERDWSLLEATQQSLREHIAEVQRLRQALESTARHKSSEWPERCQQMVDTARAALAEQPEQPAEQEPVAYMLPRDGDDCAVFREPSSFATRYSPKGWTPLYTAPQPAIPPGYKLVPVEPTNKMRRAAVISKEGNAVYKSLEEKYLQELEDDCAELWSVMLNAAPEAPQPAKQPLTREEIDAVMRKALGYGLSPSRDDLELVRAIERAHGIGEQE